MVGRLLGYQVVTGIIRCETGLRIGASSDSLEIGGLDNPIIVEPIHGMPYIPGSSLKGKMRSLLELAEGKFNPNGEPYSGAKNDGSIENCNISRLFGPHRNPNHKFGPSRLIVRDAHLTEEWKQLFISRKTELGNQFLDIKTENTINRNTGAARHPRHQERVPVGTEFDFEFVLRNFDWNEVFGNEEVDNLRVLADVMVKLEKDYLGGSGTRGYGKVIFMNVKVDGKPYDIDTRSFIEDGEQ